MASGKCLKCDRAIPRDTYKRLCEKCRRENEGDHRIGGQGGHYPPPSEFAEYVMLVDSRDEIDPLWRGWQSGDVQFTDERAIKDSNDYELLQKQAEGE